MKQVRHPTPAYVRSVLNALQFVPRELDLRLDLSEEEWAKALQFCDRSRLTLPLYLRCSPQLPLAVRSRLQDNLANNEERWRRLKTDCQELFSALTQSGIRFIVLKGFTHCPQFVKDPRHRVQYDIDLLLTPDQIGAASAIAAKLGYERATPATNVRTDHLPTLIRKTGWNWQSDYFDLAIPYSLELHFRCWDAAEEYFGPQGVEELFWNRAQSRTCEELSFKSLSPGDLLLYAALHILRHLLRGSLCVANVYEVGYFLELHSDDHAFWQEWNDLHSAQCRVLQAFSFRLAQLWFNCRLHPIAQAAIADLPLSMSRWLEHYADAPLSAFFWPNKDELWLHWSFVRSPRDRWRVLRRKLFPAQLPGPVAALHVRPEHLTWRVRLMSRWQHRLFVCRRFGYHVAALLPTLASAVRWFGGPHLARFLNH